MARARGSIYKQPKSPYWWVSYYVNGKQIRESTKTEDKNAAQKILAEKVVASKIPDKRIVGQLLDGLIADYENNHRKGVDWCKTVVRAHLRKEFGHMKSEAFTKQAVVDYIDMRRKAGRKNATINREVSLLRRAFTLAEADFPRISKLAENNVRKGFLTPEEYVFLLDKLPNHLKPIFQFAYRTGCRRGEILKLRWHDVNLRDKEAILWPGETKSGEGRTVPLTSDLVRMFEGMPRIGDYVFTYHGKPIKSIKGGWGRACKAAGLENLLFHDMRRTGVRNLMRSGVSEAVAMSISGHRTRAVFDRYNIVSTVDKHDAMAKLEAAQTNLERQAEAKLPGRIDDFMVKVESAQKKTKKRQTRSKEATSIG